MLGFTPLSSSPLSSTGGLILEGSAAILGRAIVTANAGAVEGSASIVARAIVTARSGITIDNTASITGYGSCVAAGNIIKTAIADITSSATVTADALVKQEEPVLINGKATVIVAGKVSQFAIAQIKSSAKTRVIGYIVGEEWTKQVAGSDIWLKQG